MSDLNARVRGPAPCPTCHGTGVLSHVHSSGRPDVIGLAITSQPCPDCGGDGRYHSPSVFQQRVQAFIRAQRPQEAQS